MHDLTLRSVTRANWRAAVQLSVLPEQQRFVSDYAPIVAIALAKAYVGSMGWHWIPYAFYRGEEIVGFVTLAYDDGTENPSQYWVLHFFIDARYQGQGYGQEALELLLEEVKARHPACQVLRLTVHPENVPAQHLYTKVGFLRTGERLEEEPVYQLRVRS